MKTDERTPIAMAPDARVLIVTAPYYRAITDMLQRGAEAAATAASAKLDRVFVPGAFEIPAAIAQASRIKPYDAYVALGCVVRGETSHYDYVCGESARGLMDLGIRDGLAIGYGILTVDTIEQAEARADPARGDKGGDAMRACLAMVALRRQLAESAR
ncbi:MAG TPA: 6,7-dimethyl-8-ribityllumazine synthase [Caulobacterales bacterium]|nr:6,7-dimethyl-8-ribityllumazine synthase [Caulobacterales bacterium]